MPKVENPRDAPYGAVALIHSRFENEQAGWGTGAVIHPRAILTCAHLVTARDGTREAVGMSAYPGYSGANRPHTGAAEALHAFYCGAFVSNRDRTWDIAVIRLVDSVDVPIVMTPSPVDDEPDKEQDIAGYPADHHFEMWRDREVWTGVNVPEHIFSYVHETSAGSSGSPVYRYNTQARIVHQHGVHSGLAENLEDKVGVLITRLTKSFVDYCLNVQLPPGQPFLVSVPLADLGD